MAAEALAAAARPPAATGRRVGRFALQRVLGRGAQATVWLGWDTRLEREVAVKLLEAAPEAGALDEWLHEARAVSRVAHANVVPVFEADVAEGRPYLVFEYVEGPTLAQARRDRPVWPAREAAELVLGVLDALAAAHAQGIVHRDLKPSNILLGGDGRPRVMDFGIAARIATGPGGGPASPFEGAVIGTPGYISPEAARGEAPTPAMDVFAAGVMLGELLAGAPLMRENDARRALLRVQREDLSLPASAKVDDALRAVVQRALARRATERFADAAAMRDALDAWLNPPQSTASPSAAGHGTVEFLLRRMKLKGDFPALSASVARIQKLAQSENENLGSLSAEILKDVALTQKLLRLVNTAHFAQAASGGVASVSRAVALVGFAGIRNLALSLVLLEHMRDQGHAAQLKDEFLRALMSGVMAAEITPVAREGEEAFLGAMFQGLGRLLVEVYFPEEAQQVREQVEAAEARGDDPHAVREAAAVRVLGIGFTELGLGIAKHWGLPDGLQRTMRRPEGEAPPRAAPRGPDRQRWAARAANELTEVLLTTDAAALPERLAAKAETFAGVLDMPARELAGAAMASRARLAALAKTMGVEPAPSAPSQRLLGRTPTLTPPAKAAPPRPAAAAAEAPAREAADAPTMVMPRRPAAGAGAAAGAHATAQLALGVQALAQQVAAGPVRLNEVLRQALETVQKALAADRVVFCLREPRGEVLAGRVGLGANVDPLVRAFRVGLADGDVIATICAKGLDTLIADSAAGSVARRLPAWFRGANAARCFLLLPLVHQGRTCGLIYVDRAEAGGMQVGEAELSLLAALRTQVLAAFRRAG
jgi:serine/threonine protein kinase